MMTRFKRWEMTLSHIRMNLATPAGVDKATDEIDDLQNEIGRLIDDMKEVSDLATARQRYLEAEAKLEAIRNLSV